MQAFNFEQRPRPRYYKLDPETNEPILADGVLDWARWYETADNRVVAQTTIPVPAGWTGEAEVSTVFLGIDHLFGVGSEPAIYETMVFGGPLDGKHERYATSDEAKAGHANMVARCKEAVAALPQQGN